MEDDPVSPGAADARLAGYGTHVWALVDYFEAYGGDVDEVARGYGVPVEVVEAALALYGQHKADIDARRQLNAA